MEKATQHGDETTNIQVRKFKDGIFVSFLGCRILNLIFITGKPPRMVPKSNNFPSLYPNTSNQELVAVQNGQRCVLMSSPSLCRHFSDGGLQYTSPARSATLLTERDVDLMNIFRLPSFSKVVKPAKRLSSSSSWMRAPRPDLSPTPLLPESSATPEKLQGEWVRRSWPTAAK